jgi:hypothetical protein
MQHEMSDHEVELQNKKIDQLQKLINRMDTLIFIAALSMIVQIVITMVYAGLK